MAHTRRHAGTRPHSERLAISCHRPPPALARPADRSQHVHTGSWSPPPRTRSRRHRWRAPSSRPAPAQSPRRPGSPAVYRSAQGRRRRVVSLSWSGSMPHRRSLTGRVGRGEGSARPAYWLVGMGARVGGATHVLCRDLDLHAHDCARHHVLPLVLAEPRRQPGP